MKSKETYRNLELRLFDTSLSIMRLIRPGQIKMIEQSMFRLGQLHPIITRWNGSCYQILDGFKRYYAAENLSWTLLQAKVLDATETLGKAMIFNYNKVSGSLTDYEEAMIVNSLKRDHLLSQKEISGLLDCSVSWVCRRLSLIDRLEERVKAQLRLNKITIAHAREIVKLPRGNQASLTGSIIANNVTSRQSALLVEMFLKSGSKQERDYLLRCPVEAIEKSGKEKDIYDCRLSKHGNQLLKSIESLTMQQHIFIGQFNNHQTLLLTSLEFSILYPKLRRLSEKSNIISALIDKRQENKQ